MDWHREDIPPNDVTERIKAVFLIGLKCKIDNCFLDNR